MKNKEANTSINDLINEMYREKDVKEARIYGNKNLYLKKRCHFF